MGVFFQITEQIWIRLRLASLILEIFYLKIKVYITHIPIRNTKRLKHQNTKKHLKKLRKFSQNTKIIIFNQKHWK